MEQKGQLYVCATPIGNLEDITLRVIRTLKEADLIAAEDTRNTIKLLNHFDIKTPMTSYHEHNRIEKAAWLVERMEEGLNVALVTDAGTPAISDPGEELVRQCLDAGIAVTSLPGPSACITALSMCGLPSRRFCFEAFLPADKKERRQVLGELRDETRTIVLYEAPHRMLRTLEELYEALGDRDISICRELTKVHEEVIRLTLAQAVEQYRTDPQKGEHVIVIRGKSEQELLQEQSLVWQDMPVAEHVEMYVSRGTDKKEAMRLAAKDRGISKREIYQALLQEEGKDKKDPQF